MTNMAAKKVSIKTSAPTLLSAPGVVLLPKFTMPFYNSCFFSDKHVLGCHKAYEGWIEVFHSHSLW